MTEERKDKMAKYCALTLALWIIISAFATIIMSSMKIAFGFNIEALWVHISLLSMFIGIAIMAATSIIVKILFE